MERTSMRRRAAALAVAAATTMTVFVGSPHGGAQVPPGDLRFGENYRQGADAAPVRGRDVPGLAVDPADPLHIVSVDVDYANGECSFKTSFDGGVTWPNSGNFEAPSSGFNPPFPDPPCFQNFDSGGYAHGNASVVFGTGGNVYTAFSAHRGPYQRPEAGIILGAGDDSLVARSTDGGRTFQTAVVAIPGGSDPQPFFIRPQVAVHRGAGTGGADRVYVSAWACRVISSGCSGGDDIREMYVARSDDNGQTWGPRVRITAATGGPVGGPNNSPGTSQVNEPSQPVVNPVNGFVYVAYRRRDTNPFLNNVEIARSTDAGQTWQQFTAGPARGGAHPRLAIDPSNGTLYIAYQDDRFSIQAGLPTTATAVAPVADQDISLVRSTDHGQNWSLPVRVNDDPVGNGLAQQVPRVEVAPNGRVDVVWFDRRNNPKATIPLLNNPATQPSYGDIYYAYSADGGQTFSANRRVTDRQLNTGVGLTSVGGYTWYGPVMAAKGTEQLLVAWTDSREGNFHTGGQDIYLSNLNLRSGSLPVKRLPDTTESGLAITMSKLAYPGGIELSALNAPGQVVVVNQDDPALALAAAPLARLNLAPLLVSPAARLTPDAKAEVQRMEAPGAFLVGGESALGAGVVAALTEAKVPADRIVRLAGATAADTAKQIALAMDFRTVAQKGANVAAFETAVVVNPAAKESMAAAGLATALRVPVLFVDQNSVPAQTKETLDALRIPTTIVVGGASAVADSVLASLPGSKRVGGGETTNVSMGVADEFKARRLPTNVVYVGDSEAQLDAALLATAVGRNGGLLLLVPGADPARAEAGLNQLGLRSVVDRLVVARSSPALSGPGYRMVARDGGIFAFPGAGFYGSTGAIRLAQPMVGMVNTSTNAGYWTVAADGGVFAFGDAKFRGSTGALRLAQPMVGMAATPTGNGYWLVAKDGGVFAFGDAKFYGSTGALRLNQPIVGIAGTPSGNGYMLVAADGGVFAFGDAAFKGSTGAIKLNRPMVGMTMSPSGNGYWMVASDGGIFAFGDAAFKGSTGAIKLNQPVVGMDSSPSGNGYWLTASDGGIFAFGDAAFLGSMGGTKINQPVVGISAG